LTRSSKLLLFINKLDKAPEPSVEQEIKETITKSTEIYFFIYYFGFIQAR